MKNAKSQGFTERAVQYSMPTVSSSTRGGFPERGNYLLESSKELLAEVHKDPEQIADLLFFQISSFKKKNLAFLWGVQIYSILKPWTNYD